MVIANHFGYLFVLYLRRDTLYEYAVFSNDVKFIETKYVLIYLVLNDLVMHERYLFLLSKFQVPPTIELLVRGMTCKRGTH